MKSTSISYKELTTHETKHRVFLKFIIIVAIFIGYFVYISQKYGVEHGFFVAALSWSFFVLCTPIADAGFLIDFPLRLVTHIKMLKSEMIGWTIAISLNLYAFFLVPDIYETTGLLSFFKHILSMPFPGWSIIFISLIGTFVSIHFGDELLDTINHKDRHFYHKHKNKFRLIVMVFIVGISFFVYKFVLSSIGLKLPI